MTLVWGKAMIALAKQDHISVAAAATGEVHNQLRVNYYIYVSTVLFVAWNKRFWLFLTLYMFGMFWQSARVGKFLQFGSRVHCTGILGI